MPLELEISTLKKIYEIRLGKIVHGRLEISNEGIIAIRLKIVWWVKKIVLFPPTGETKKKIKDKEIIKSAHKKTKKNPIKNIVGKSISVLKSFKVKRFYLDIDTNDYILNAYLYPAFFAIKQWKGLNIQVNFMGREEVDILIKNNLLRMGIAFFRNK